jgi:hypothetical protein
VCVLLGEKTRPLFLAGQGEQPAINLFEPRVFALGIDLAKDRSVERSVGCCAAWARPQAFDLHRFDHCFAIHRFFCFGQDRNRSFDLAHLLFCGFRFLGGRLRDRGVLLGSFGCRGLGGCFGVTVGFGGGLGSHVRVPVFRGLCFALVTITNVGHTVTSEGKPHPAASSQNFEKYFTAIQFI